MSELKAYSALIYGVSKSLCQSVYLKSEANKVIADLEESHKREVEQLLMEIVELKEKHKTEVKELRHQKFKRCLAMALLSLEKRESYRVEYEEWCLKWYKRWLELADKFKRTTFRKELPDK